MFCIKCWRIGWEIGIEHPKVHGLWSATTNFHFKISWRKLMMTTFWDKSRKIKIYQWSHQLKLCRELKYFLTNIQWVTTFFLVNPVLDHHFMRCQSWMNTNCQWETTRKLQWRREEDHRFMSMSHPQHITVQGWQTLYVRLLIDRWVELVISKRDPTYRGGKQAYDSGLWEDQGVHEE